MDKFKYKEDWKNWIGKKVMKFSGKPFKSSFKVNTIKDITKNQNSGKLAFTFKEDNSIVDCYQCILPMFIRQSGYYWVKFSGIWTIGQYCEFDKDWRLCGAPYPFYEHAFDEIEEYQITKI